MWHGRPIFRIVVQAGAAAVVVLGAAAIVRIRNAAHFEGFVHSLIGYCSDRAGIDGTGSAGEAPLRATLGCSE